MTKRTLVLWMAVGLALPSGCRSGPSARTRAQVDMAKLLLKEVATALDRYHLDVGHYPTAEEGGLKALRTKPTFEDEATAEKWAGPYVSMPSIKDPWGRPLKYEHSMEAGRPKVVLRSLGPDGQDGTEDDISHDVTR